MCVCVAVYVCVRVCVYAHVSTHVLENKSKKKKCVWVAGRDKGQNKAISGEYSRPFYNLGSIQVLSVSL